MRKKIYRERAEKLKEEDKRKKEEEAKQKLEESKDKVSTPSSTTSNPNSDAEEELEEPLQKRAKVIAPVAVSLFSYFDHEIFSNISIPPDTEMDPLQFLNLASNFDPENTFL